MNILTFSGGTTLHAFAGIGDGSGTIEHLCERAAKLPLVAQKWRKCKHLIIDEISMVDGAFFEVLFVHFITLNKEYIVDPG